MSTEEELKNTQARLNLLTNFTIETLKVLCTTQPYYIPEQIGEMVRMLESAEDNFPMKMDNE